MDKESIEQNYISKFNLSSEEVYGLLEFVSKKDDESNSVFFSEKVRDLLHDYRMLIDEVETEWNDELNSFVSIYETQWTNFKTLKENTDYPGRPLESDNYPHYTLEICLTKFIFNIQVSQGENFLKEEYGIKYFSEYSVSNYNLSLINDTNSKYLSGKEFEKLKKYVPSELLEILIELNQLIEKTIDTSVQEFKKISESKSNLIDELDNNNDGVIDLIEDKGDEVMNLLRKHQSKIIGIDKDYVQKIIKVSSYIKTKKDNIQTIFEEIKSSSTENEMNDLVGILQNNIHTFELVLFHSINMITSLVEDDLITFYEIYETFDKLKMFNTTWENEVSEKLNDIGDGLMDLMYSINKMESNIVREIGNLSYVTQESFKSLGNSVSKELQSIDSSIKFNNLLTGISTYQLYKINKKS